MRIVITGGGGTLGLALAPTLARTGHDPVLVDIADVATKYEFVRCDIRDAEATRRALDGSDLVVHAAAIHGIHLGDHSPEQFFALNLTGTFNVWEASVAARVQGVVFSSTMGVYGQSRKPTTPDSIVALHEDVDLRPTDIYAFTKVAGEEMCRYYARQSGIPSVALRFGMFVPETFFRYGIRLLYGGVGTEDVVAAVVGSLDALISRRVDEFEALNVHSYLPFTPADGPLLRGNPLDALDAYYPGAAELLQQRGVSSLAAIDSYFPVSRLQQRLGVRPLANFDRWLEELRQRADERAKSSPPWP